MCAHVQLYLGQSTDANSMRYSTNLIVRVHQELCLASGVLSVGKPPPAVHCHHSQHTHPARVPQHIVQDHLGGREKIYIWHYNSTEIIRLGASFIMTLLSLYPAPTCSCCFQVLPSPTSMSISPIWIAKVPNWQLGKTQLCSSFLFLSFQILRDTGVRY